MLFLPYRTDAPVYHTPWGTISLIVVNLVVFGLTWTQTIETPSLILSHGDGLHPHQWITSNFVHADWHHIVGNMVFLYAFGLLVEGKIGTLRFLPLYLGIGVVQASLEQLICLQADPGGSYGASSILFGLLAIAMLWAPKNEVSIFWWIYIRAGSFPLTVQTLGIIFVALNMGLALIAGGFGRLISTGSLHLMGAAIGFPIGLLMLKKGWVDCEGWDWFSVRRGEHLDRAYGPLKAAHLADDAIPSAGSDLDLDFEESDDRALALDLLRNSLEAGDAENAWEVYRGQTHGGTAWVLEREDLARLVNLLYDAKRWKSTLSLARAFVARFPGQDSAIHLRCAALLLKARQPQATLTVLAHLADEEISEAERALKARLSEKAQSEISAGTLEFGD